MANRVIKDQVITTSGTDTKGVTVSKDAVLAMFRGIQEPVLLRQEHNRDMPPAGRATNFRIRDLPDGNVALTADVEIWNEQLMTDTAGMSIAWTNASDGELEPGSYDVALLIDPTAIPFELLRGAVDSWDGELRVARAKLYQRGVAEVAIVVLSFVSIQFAGGFFRRAGADAYDVLKKRLGALAANIGSQTGKLVEFRCEFTYNVDNHDIKVLVPLSPADIDGLRNHPLDIDQVRLFLDTHVGESRISEVLIRYKSKKPHYSIGHVVDLDGKLIQLGLPKSR